MFTAGSASDTLHVVTSALRFNSRSFFVSITACRWHGTGSRTEAITEIGELLFLVGRISA
jgi:hypothetical protein